MSLETGWLRVCGRFDERIFDVLVRYSIIYMSLKEPSGIFKSAWDAFASL